MKDFDLRVLGAVLQYHAEHGTCPSVRKVGIAIGYPHPKEVWWSLLRLEELGIIEWPKDKRGRRVNGGMRLSVPLKKPTTVPLLGTLVRAPDYVPGSRYVEFSSGGVWLVDADGTRHECGIRPVSWV